MICDHTTGTIPNEVQPLVAMLLRVFSAQEVAYARLLAHVEQGHEAVAAADVDRLLAIRGPEQELADQLVELERHRVDLTHRLSALIQPGSEGPVSITDMADVASAEDAAELQDAAVRLREIAVTVRQRSTVLREAMERLCGHAAGLVQAMQTAVSQVGTYGRRGRLTEEASVQCSIDVRR